jgi:ubiquinone/menaquinone biosynthesis C-methylase UbiE
MIVGLDLSRAMLTQCVAKAARRALIVELVEGEASSLPFASDAFDAVLHHGGLAEFGNPGSAIAEMMRVVRPGAKVVICDVGVPEDHTLSLVNRVLLRFQPEYDKPPPMRLLPSGACDPTLSWFHRGSWYMIEFAKPEAPSKHAPAEA